MALLMKSVYIQSIGEALLVTAVYAVASGNLGLVSFTKFPERLTLEKNAHLNVISHLLSLIPYEDLTPEHLELPPRQEVGDYQHPDISQFNIVPAVYP